MHVKKSEDGCRALLGFYSSHIAFCRMTNTSLTDAKVVIRIWGKYRVRRVPASVLQHELDTLVEEGILDYER